jgi:hypothetical protein
MRLLGVIVALLVVTVDLLYVWYIEFVQSALSDQPWRVPFVASYLGALAICALLSAVVSGGSWRVVLAGAAASGLLVLGFLGMFSIGLPLFVMGLLTTGALVMAVKSAVRPGLAAGAPVVGALVAVIVLVAGLGISERVIACSPGLVSGGGTTFLSGSYSYTCQNGRAIVTWGK